MTEQLSAVAAFLRRHDNYDILTHDYPDGDTLGSAFALCLVLQQMGKHARVITTYLPDDFLFLQKDVEKQDFVAQTVVSVDVADTKLLGSNRAVYEGKIDLCIDHHMTNKVMVPLRLVDGGAAANCEILYKLFRHMEISWTRAIANCLYTGISTDTGCFRYTNTTAETLRIAADIMDIGCDVAYINKVMFETKSKKRIALEREIYDTMEYCLDGRCAIIAVTLKIQRRVGVSDGELEGLASIPRQIENRGRVQGFGAHQRRRQRFADLRGAGRRRTFRSGRLHRPRHAGAGKGNTQGDGGAVSMNGVIVIDKPQGFTSFDVIAVVRRLTGQRKTGHTGTLDPNATGVLPVLLGAATKAQDLIVNHDKEYRADFRLGLTTDTLDIWGRETAHCESRVTRAQIEALLPQFTGEIRQIPPMYSAVQQNGQRLYDLARKGIEVERQARQVTVYRLELTAFDETAQSGELLVRCSKGTYVRTLIDDIGAALGVGAVMTALRRTFACGYTLSDCVTLDELKALAQDGKIAERLRPVESLFDVYDALTVSEAQAKRFQNGASLDLSRTSLRSRQPENQTILRVKNPSGDFLGLGITADGALKNYKLFAPAGASGG